MILLKARALSNAGTPSGFNSVVGFLSIFVAQIILTLNGQILTAFLLRLAVKLSHISPISFLFIFIILQFKQKFYV